MTDETNPIDALLMLAKLDFVEVVNQGEKIIVPPVCLVPEGEFWMGSDRKQDAVALATEMPQHRVTLPAYHIGRFPITVAEYTRFVQVTNHAAPAIDGLVDWATQLLRPTHPVVCTTWHDAVAYAAWLSSQTAEHWRLPTEAEWEIAARWDPVAGVSRIYPWGNTFDQSRCNTIERWGSSLGTTTMVGAYPNGASPCGAQDMAGNINEWTSSRFTLYPLTNIWEWLGSRFQPDRRESLKSGESEDLADNCVLRGGSFYDFARFARAASRRHSHWVATTSDPPSGNRSADAGFRLVREIVTQHVSEG